MRYSKYAIVVLLLFCFGLAHAQTVQVTNILDAGPGSLRQAMLGIPTDRTIPYIIHFSIPGTPTNDGMRTIRLKTALPVIPSNVIIDGSSQNWTALGVSGAKIILEPEVPGTTFSGLSIGSNYANFAPVTNVEIYGLYLKDFARITDLRNVNQGQGSGIVVNYRAGNIKIGAPGKGNVISGNINGISLQSNYYYSSIAVSPIIIQSNLIGVHYDGVTAKTNVTGILGNLDESSINIGGDNANEGNVISANQFNVVLNRVNQFNNANRFEINLVNNKIGTDYTGTVDFSRLALFLSSSQLELAGVKVNATASNLTMRKNVVSGNRTVGISVTNSSFIITGNRIGTGSAGTEKLKNGTGVRVESMAEGTLGGGDPGEDNLIAYNDYGFESFSSRPVKITRNSFFCNVIGGIMPAKNILQPYIQLLKKEPGSVSGKATPNAEIELFYTDNCPNCEGKEYFATVRSGTDGRWQSPVPANRNVTATASLLNATTSPFADGDLLPNEAIEEPVTCLGNGSIKVLEPRVGITFQWYKILPDASRVPIGNTQEILNLEEGFYELEINDGCKVIKHAPLYEIKDQKLGEATVTVPPPDCGQMNFTFTANADRGKGVVTYEWFNNAGVSLGFGKQKTFEQGSYYVMARDEAGCVKTSAVVSIVRKPMPIINTSNAVFTDASCGQSNGGITGLTINDVTGTASYAWYKYDAISNRFVNTSITTLDLTGQEGGRYQLVVRDAGACSPVSMEFFINVRNTLSITEGIIRNTTCNQDNGTINQVVIYNADQYEWFDPAGVSMGGKMSYVSGTTLPIQENLKVGRYRLVASLSNASCTKEQFFNVTAIAPTQYQFTVNISPATCGLNNGKISLNYQTNSPLPVRFQWKDIAGVDRSGTIRELKDLEPGTYSLFAYDVNGCEMILGPYEILLTPLLVIEPSSGVVTDDGCTLLRGAVKGVRINGGIAPYTFSWTNEAGALVQSTQDLIGVPEGKYKLTVKDQTGCGLAISEVYTVANPSFIIPTPVMNDLRVCYATEIILPVIGPEEGTYQLFQKEDDAMPIMESTNGRFIFKVSKTADYFLRRKLGTCVSEFRKVNVEVTNDNLDIKNTMTPNGDGMNDFWMITGLPEKINIDIKLYTRSGQLVYESMGQYTKPFDGRFRGKDLPAGVYYYVIDLRADCKPLGGSLTLLR